MGASKPLNVFDYETLAREALPAAAWDYIAAGADDEVTLARNRSSFERIAIHPRVLIDVERIDTSTTVLGQSVASPVLIAPTGYHQFVCADAELATAAAAAAANTILVASTSSSRSIEEIAAAAASPVWFQLYLFRDRGRSAQMVRRAQAAGCRAIVLTVDAPRWGRKERSLRTESELTWHVGNLAGLPPPTEKEYADGAPATWADIERSQASTPCPRLSPW